MTFAFSNVSIANVPRFTALVGCTNELPFKEAAQVGDWPSNTCLLTEVCYQLGGTVKVEIETKRDGYDKGRYPSRSFKLLDAGHRSTKGRPKSPPASIPTVNVHRTEISG